MKRRQNKIMNTAVVSRAVTAAVGDERGRIATRAACDKYDSDMWRWCGLTCEGGDSSKGGNYNNYGGRL